MNGIDRRRIRRRPTRSMLRKATKVKMKFVMAMEREANVGEVKPTRAKMVAEKYLKWSTGNHKSGGGGSIRVAG